MKFLKRLLLGLLILVILLFAVSFVLPSKVHVERSTNIKTKPDAVYALVNDLRTYDDWMPWNKKDSAMKKVNGETQVGVNAWYSCNGKLTITESVPNQKVVTQLDFGEHGVSYGGWEMAAKGETTDVKWYMDSEASGNFLTKAISKYMFLFMDKMVGKDFEAGLAKLKTIAESKPVVAQKEPTMKLETTTAKTMMVLYVADTAKTMADIGPVLGKAYGEIGAFMSKNNIQPVGPPLAWYYGGQNAPYPLEAGMPASKLPATVEGRIKSRTVEGGPAIVVRFWGPYEMGDRAYTMINDWLKKNNKTANGAPYEVYIGDPEKEKDPYKVQTDFYQQYK
jgi:effector-binding domain-containing protein/ribosome-associated toxin RatA of RatAB toxin-antitoxin module